MSVHLWLSVLALSLVLASPTLGDERTRWSSFRPEAELQICGTAPSNVARSYCYDEIDKKLRRAIRWADGYVAKRLSDKAKLPDSFPSYEGKYATEALQTLRQTSDAYAKLIPADCQAASWEMRGGSGQGLLAQSCAIGHRMRLWARYQPLID
jgi:hypothetical protein